MNRDQMRSLLIDYNRNPNRYNDNEAEAIAMMAKQMGQHFRKESRPLAKGAYSALDMMTLGLLMPDQWEPQSRGESVYGETGLDQFASGLGTIAGFGGSLGLAAKGARGVWNMGTSVNPKDRIRQIAQKMSQQGRNIGGKGADILAKSPAYHNLRYGMQNPRQAIGRARDRLAGSPLYHRARYEGARGAKELRRTARTMGEGLRTAPARARAYAPELVRGGTAAASKAAAQLAARLNISVEQAQMILAAAGGATAIGGSDYMMGGFGD